MISNPIYGKIKNGNQTTNQIITIIIIITIVIMIIREWPT